MTKVSIIIPCYNAENYLDQCVTFLEKQDYKDFKIVFVNDASTDDTLNKIYSIKSEKKLNITVINNTINVGPAVSRNKGIQTTDTEYITFCDADDWYDIDYISKMVSALENNDVDTVFCGYRVVSGDSKEERPIVDQNKICSAKEALIVDVDSLCTMMTKTSIMRQVSLPDLRNGEDMAVVPLVVTKSSRCMFLNDCMYNYSRRSNSASENASMDVVNSLIESYIFMNNSVDHAFSNELEYIGMRNLIYAGLITLFSFSNNHHKANEILELFENDFPNWHNNIYMTNMPKYKQIILGRAYKRRFNTIYMIALARKIIRKKY